MWERLGWFAIAYACISLTVTVVMLVVANRAFKLGGPVGMVRFAFILVLVVVGFIVWATKKAAGYSPPGESANDQIKRTIRKTSGWLDGLKHEWDDAKSGSGRRSQLPGARDRDQR